MSARLFRRIKSSFSRFNKTLFFSVAILVTSAFFLTTTIFAAEDATLDLQYNNYISLFNGTSYIAQSGLQNSTSNGDAVGIVFTVNLNIIPPAGVSLKDSWARVTTQQKDAFIIKLCQENIPSKCWLSTVPYTQLATAGQNVISMTKTATGEYVDDQTINTATFSMTSGDTTTVTNDMAGTDIGADEFTATIKTGGDIYSYNGSSVTPIKYLVASKGISLVASLWYCASGPGADAAAAYANKKVDSAKVSTFGTLCEGKTYFRIGTPTPPFSVPTDKAALAQQVAAGQAAVATTAKASSSETSTLPACGIIGSNATINGCVARVAYGLYVVVAWVAGILGKLFDFFLGYSVSDASYRYDFAVNGWRLVRDISNIFFIIVMVWTGFSAVFDTGKAGSMKKIVPQLILNALLINFSLFATRVVIDLSNITARMFYSQMVVCEQVNLQPDGKCDPALAKRGAGGYWPLSEKIVSSFNPQQLFKTASLQPSVGQPEDGAVDFNAASVGRSAGVSATDYANYFTVICIVATLIMGLVGVMFFKVAFLFVGRVVGLYLCMIFAPFAFLSWNIPLLGSVDKLHWKDWTKELTSYALLAPVFIFFLYIIYTFLSSDLVQQIGYKDSTGDFMGTALGVIIPMLIIFFLLNAAQKAASKLSGGIGQTVQGWGQSLTGFAAGTALGIATGGASLAGTSAAGIFKTGDQTRARLQAQKAAGGLRGQFAGARLAASDWSQKQTFDARNTTAVKKLNGVFGMNPNNKLVGALGFSGDRTKGGRDGQIKRAETATKSRIESIKTTFTKDEDATAFWDDYVKGDQMQKYLNGAAQAKFKEENGRKATKEEMDSADFQAKKDAVLDENFGKVTNNKKLTKALQTKYADTILNENETGLNAPKDALRMGAVGGAKMALGTAAVTSLAPVGALALGALTDNTGKRKSAKSFLEAQKKAIKDAKKKKPRADALAEQNKEMEEELKAINKDLNDIYQAEIDNNQNNPAFQGRTVDYYSDKANAAEAREVVEKRRQQYKNQHDEEDLEVQRLTKEYEELVKKGNPNAMRDAEEIKNQRNAAIAKRNASKAKYDSLDGKRKKDLENNINKNDGELDKIKEKEKAAEEKGSGDKKDDKK